MQSCGKNECQNNEKNRKKNIVISMIHFKLSFDENECICSRNTEISKTL